MDRKAFENQLASLEQELKQIEAAAYKTDGAIQLLKHLIAQFDEAPVKSGKRGKKSEDKSEEG